MRVVTWNVRHGRPRRGFALNGALAGTVQSLDPDLIAVQEVEQRVIRSWFADQPALIGRAARAGAVYFAPARRLMLFGRDGIALCVRGRFEHVRTFELPRHTANQRRLAIVARVVAGDVAFTVAATHLHNDAPVAQLQLDALVADISDEPGPRILLGDLNLRPDEIEGPLRVAGFTLVDTDPTEPAWAPVQRIDHVAVDGFSFGEASVPEVPVSDHRPVIVDDVRPAQSPGP